MGRGFRKHGREVTDDEGGERGRVRRGEAGGVGIILGERGRVKGKVEESGGGIILLLYLSSALV